MDLEYSPLTPHPTPHPIPPTHFVRHERFCPVSRFCLCCCEWEGWVRRGAGLSGVRKWRWRSGASTGLLSPLPLGKTLISCLFPRDVSLKSNLRRKDKDPSPNRTCTHTHYDALPVSPHTLSFCSSHPPTPCVLLHGKKGTPQAPPEYSDSTQLPSTPPP